MPDRLGTNSQQPTTNNKQPTTNNKQPTTNNNQPTTNNNQQLQIGKRSISRFEPMTTMTKPLDRRVFGLGLISNRPF